MQGYLTHPIVNTEYSFMLPFEKNNMMLELIKILLM